MDIWQEIDQLKQEITRLDNLLTRQCVIIAQHPAIKIGNVVADNTVDGNRVYAVQERTFASTKDEVYAGVRLMPGDPGSPVNSQPVAFYVDANGERYILPSAQRLILIQDFGGGQGKHIEKDSASVVTTPPGSETLPIVVAEPNASFHNTTPATASGRIYPGMKLATTDGSTKYYLVFLEGHGDGEVNHDVDLGNGTSLRITTDYAGKFVSGVLV